MAHRRLLVRILLEDVALTTGLAVLVAAMALGTLHLSPSDVDTHCRALGDRAAEMGWWARTVDLLAASASMHFCDSPIVRGSTVIGALRAAQTTGLLVGAAMLLSAVIAIPLGMLCAVEGAQRSLGVRAVRRGVALLSSVPVLVWCTAIFLIAARTFNVIPGDTQHARLTMGLGVMALTLGDRLVIDLLLRTEQATRETLAQPYFRLVRAGGFGVARHLLQSLVSPIATALLTRTMYLVGSAIVVELLFDLPGLGVVVRESLATATPSPKVAMAATLVVIAAGVATRVVQRTATASADRRSVA
ncbi:MAG: ABC transporter permease subunit [Gemmatimonadaceae bacterium]|nr:ABC transporter permease subunit [Gemmatimonadaceae bacterium]